MPRPSTAANCFNAATAYSALGYLAGSVGYVAIPVIVVLAAARPSRATIADMVWPGDGERRLAAAAFWAPLLLPALGALASGTEITSLWSMPAWTLLPVLLLSSPAVKVCCGRHAPHSDRRGGGAAGHADRRAGDRHLAHVTVRRRIRRKPHCWRTKSNACGMRRHR